MQLLTTILILIRMIKKIEHNRKTNKMILQIKIVILINTDQTQPTNNDYNNDNQSGTEQPAQQPNYHQYPNNNQQSGLK